MKKSMITISLLCAASAAWATLVVDDFERTVLATTDATAFNANLPGYATWMQDTAKEWQISGGYMHSHVAAAPGLLYENSLQTTSGGGDSFTVSMDISVKQNAVWGAGVLFNYQDESNYYMLRIKSDTTQYQVLKCVGGGLSGISGATTDNISGSNFGRDLWYTVTITSDTAYKFDYTITPKGSSTVLASGTKTDAGAHFAGGHAGLYTGAPGWSAGHDNFSLEVIPEPVTLGLVGLMGGGLLWVRKRFAI